MPRYDFLLETYDTERLKTLSVWSQFRDEDLRFRPEPRARTPQEQMVHQCVSEDTWFRNMLGIDLGAAALPAEETRLAFLHNLRRRRRQASRAAARDAGRLVRGRHPLLRRGAQPGLGADAADRPLGPSSGAAHRLPAAAGPDLYSTYGPTADTGGLFQNGAPVVYRYPDLDRLLEAEAHGGDSPPLPGPGAKSPTERPD